MALPKVRSPYYCTTGHHSHQATPTVRLKDRFKKAKSASVSERLRLRGAIALVHSRSDRPIVKSAIQH
ncbi:hypothetical protein [Nostoc sp. DSM 114160]